MFPVLARLPGDWETFPVLDRLVPDRVVLAACGCLFGAPLFRRGVLVTTFGISHSKTTGGSQLKKSVRYPNRNPPFWI